MILWLQFPHFLIERVRLEGYFNSSQDSNPIVLKKLKRAICGIKEKEREEENQNKNLIRSQITADYGTSEDDLLA